MSEKKKSESEGEESRALVSEKEPKSAKAASREARPSKSTQREAKLTPAPAKKAGGFRNWRVVRFTRESYRELRYKVTWPTFQEARNMTFAVIVLSTVVGVLLGVVDQGLFQLFRVVTGK